MSKIHIAGKKVAIFQYHNRLSEKEIKEKLEALGAIVVPLESKEKDILFAPFDEAPHIMKSYDNQEVIYSETLLYKLLEIPPPNIPETIIYLNKRLGLPKRITPDNSATEFLKRSFAEILTNYPHPREMNSFALSSNGKYFATGDRGGIDAEKEHGNLAVWEVATGRVRRHFDSVRGGIGWSGDYGGCIQWSPNDGMIGVAFNTNGIGTVEPFRANQPIYNSVYPTSWGHPSNWCFSHGGLPMFISAWLEEADEISPLPGIVTTPYDRRVENRQMLETEEHFSSPFDNAIQPFEKMIWTTENIIVGFNKRHKQCYAIHAHTRKLIWAKTAEAVAFHPNGKEMILHLDDIQRISIATGEAIQEVENSEDTWEKVVKLANRLIKRIPKEKEEKPLQLYKEDAFIGNYHYSPDGSMFVKASISGVHLFRNNEYSETISYSIKSKSWNTVDLEPVAFSQDSRFLAVINGSEEIVVWNIEEKGAKKIMSMNGSAYNGIFFGADHTIIAASPRRLTFINAMTGEIIADHPMLDRPSVPSVADEIDGLTHFPMGDRWGYILRDNNIVIASKDPSPYLHISFRGNWILPLEWAKVKVFPNFKTAIAEVGDEINKNLLTKLKKWKDPRDAFFSENKHTLEDLENDYIEFYRELDYKKKKTDFRDKAENIGEMIHYFLRSGQVERGLEVLKQIPLDDFHDIHQSIPPIIAYLAKIGETTIAQALTDKITPLYKGVQDQFSIKFDAWLGAAGHLLNNAEAYRLQVAFDAVGAGVSINAHSRIAMRVATSYAFIDNFEKAIKATAIAVEVAFSKISWEDTCVCTNLIFQSNDFDIIKRYLLTLEPKIGNHDEGILTQFCKHFMAINRPTLLLEWLTLMDNERLYFIANIRSKLLDHLGKIKGGAALFELIKEDLKVAKSANQYDKEAELLTIWCPYDKVKALPYVKDLIERVIKNRQVKNDFLREIAGILHKTGQDQLLATLYKKARSLSYRNCINIILYLPNEEELCEKALEKLKKGDDVRILIRYLKTTHPAYSTIIKDRMEIAKKWFHDAEALLDNLLAKEDLENAYTLYLTNPTSKGFHKIIARNAIRRGNFTVGIHFLNKLPPGRGTNDYTNEMLQALVRDCWDNENWTCHIF